jgi:hypothetical protein
MLPTLMLRTATRLAAAFALATLIWIQSAPRINAAGPATLFPVLYSPGDNPVGIFDAVPAGVPTSYTVDVTSPANFPSGQSFSPTGSAISILVTTGDAIAASYLSVALDPATTQPATYTVPGQTLRFRITGTFPLVNVSTTYAYTVSIVNWPVSASSLNNRGHFITATSVPPPPPTANPPTIQVSSPINNPTYTSATLPVTVPLSFTAVATTGHPISNVSATLSGPGLTGQPIVLSLLNPNSASVTATANLSVTAQGDYTVNMSAANNQSTVTAQTSFHLSVTGIPPVVTIAEPLPGSSFTVGAAPTVHVPLTFEAACTSGTLKSVLLTVDGVQTPFSPGLTAGLTDFIATSPLDYGTGALGKHTVVVVATNDFGSTSATTNFVVLGTQTITFGPLPAHTYGDAPFGLAATSTAGLPISYASSDPTVATVSGNTVTILHAGTTTITASQPGNTYCAAAVPVSQMLVVNQAPQTITFNPLPARMVGDPAFTLAATASSGLPVSYASSNPAVASVSGSTVTIVSAGATVITASQPGNSNYLAATPVDQTLIVQVFTSSCGTAIVRHAPDLNGNAGVNGSLQVLLPENLKLNGNDWISGNLLVPGAPDVRINGHPTIGAVIDGTGSVATKDYTITFDGKPVLGRLIRRTDPVTIPLINTPPTSAGTRDVKLNQPGDGAGNFATVRDLTVGGDYGQLAVPPGVYRDLTANGGSGFTLGVAGATQPSIYYLRNLKMSGTGCLKIVGPVTLTIVDDIDFDGAVGNSTHADWLTLNLYSGDLTMNGSMKLYANVLAPFGTIRLNGLAQLCGGLKCDRLRLDGNALIDVCGCNDGDNPSGSDNDHGNGGDDDQSHGSSDGGNGDDHGGGHD